MPYEQNIGKYIIDSINQRGCYIVLVESGIYRCTDWEVLSNYFQSTIDGMPNSGLPVALNANDVANNPNLSIVNSPNAPLTSGYENPIIPAGVINGTNVTFTTPYNYDPASLMVYEDGLLLNSNNPAEIVKLSATQFKILPAPLVGSQVIVIAKIL